MSLPRVTPSFVVAVLALVIASGGVGFAAGQITSAQIKDGTIQGRDVMDGGLTGSDVRDGTIPRRKVSRSCPSGSSEVFGGCVARSATGPSSHQAAIDDCNRKNGRLPTTQELRWIATHDEYSWADGNVSQYEFSGDSTATTPYSPIGFDRAFNAVPNSSAQLFWHHCVVTY